ncbi:PREDICTED: collagen alpha-1(XXIII) chain-like [Gekko japonicus]|uniref:Collagen alpha-1(XXIII) chain-like n=1 Tax=Gekko japonicus TaxID=146911 RepID=A0ABM1L982_GEKJA|nr:PREDICTED: collagen alpha-1(XXIII) chain-like [Gekko japonicus]
MSEPREQAAAAAAAASPQGGCRCAGGGVGRAPAVLSLLFSLLSVGACFLLSARTSKLQGRLVALEGELASRAWSPGDQLDAEPWLALLQPQVDRVLQEKLGEGLAKLRTAREAPSECRCPPGPPGRRGKPGRRGEPGPPGQSGRDGYPTYAGMPAGSSQLFCEEIFSLLEDKAEPRE